MTTPPQSILQQEEVTSSLPSKFEGFLCSAAYFSTLQHHIPALRPWYNKV
jgi:hypothetical protein